MQVASAGITEIYLSEFRLVWKTVLARLQSVFLKAYRLSDGNSEVLVDAVRGARLLDAVLKVCCAATQPTMSATFLTVL
jgi:hypothetical protein